MTDHDESLRELAKQLPWDRPDVGRREAVRSQLLVAASEGDEIRRARWPLPVAFGGALAAAAAIVLVVSLRGARGVDTRTVAAVEPRAQIQATSDSDFERNVARVGERIDEIVRVHHGTLHVSVGALEAGAHVRVATRDAEVEGAGSYDVVAVGDELREVDVREGRAVVRVVGQREVYLAAGDVWRARVVTAELGGSGEVGARVSGGGEREGEHEHEHEHEYEYDGTGGRKGAGNGRGRDAF